MALRDYVLEDGSWDKLKIEETVLEFFDRSDAVVSRSPTGLKGCRYRQGSGKHDPHRCPFGVLIGDDEYDSDMEGDTSWFVLRKWFPTIYNSVGSVGRHWMLRLQMAHDSEYEIEAVRENLHDFFRDVK